jgi:long-chain acyl-CoA synthetase
LLSIAHILPRAARANPQRVAVHTESGPITYAELLRRVNALAGALRARGVAKGDRVAILDVNSSRYLEAYYAAAQLGVILVPVNSRLAAAEVVYILNDCQAALLLYSSSVASTVEAVRPKLESVREFLSYGCADIRSEEDYEAVLAAAEPCTDLTPNHPNDVCNIYYTSGTTGNAKGVCLTYGNMWGSMLDISIQLGLRHGEVWMHAAPMFHLVDAWSVWAIPMLGGTQVPIPFEPIRFLSTVQATRATAVALPPTLISMVAGHERFADYDLSSLRMIMFGGSPAPEQLMRNAAQRLPIQYIHVYGTTETSGILTSQTAEDTFAIFGAAGHPSPNIDVSILDNEDQPVPPGTVGEIVVRGSRVMSHYWRNEAATAEAMRNGWYHTGDMGYLGAGDNLYIVDRKKDMIITGGENVYSVEVETALASHPSVLEVTVIGVPSTRWGEEVKGIVALIPGRPATQADLIAHCKAQIAAYKCPKSIDILEGGLPKTGSGKIAKKALRESYWAGHQARI